MRVEDVDRRFKSEFRPLSQGREGRTKQTTVCLFPFFWKEGVLLGMAGVGRKEPGRGRAEGELYPCLLRTLNRRTAGNKS